MNRRVVAIIVAVLLAVLGTTAVLIYVNNADARALEGKDSVTVLVAAKPIAAGTSAQVARESFRAEKMPAESVPSDALSAIDENLNKLVTSTNIAQGQLLTRGMLVKASTQDDVVLPSGKLAVSIPVKGAEQAGSTLKPGFDVALFNTFTVADDKAKYTPSGEQLTFGPDKNQATRLLLPKVEVISVIAEKKGEKSDSFGKYLVTVAVTQAEAEKLIHALATGVVSIAQVNDGSKVVPGAGVDTFHLFTKNGS
jgi:pilus assembly protein CpaB